MYDSAGWCVAITYDGNLITNGAIWNDDTGPLSGHMQPYECINNNWNQIRNNIFG